MTKKLFQQPAAVAARQFHRLSLKLKGVLSEDKSRRSSTPCRASTHQSIFLSTTFIEATQCTPSSERSWRAVSVLPSPLNAPVQRVCSPCQVQVLLSYDSVSRVMFPWLSKK